MSFNFNLVLRFRDLLILIYEMPVAANVIVQQMILCYHNPKKQNIRFDRALRPVFLRNVPKTILWVYRC